MAGATTTRSPSSNARWGGKRTHNEPLACLASGGVFLAFIDLGIAGIALALASLGAGVAQGAEQRRMQRSARRRSELAQLQALDLAQAEKRRAADALTAAQGRTPVYGSLLGEGQDRGVGSTLLTGPQGADTSSLTLGRRTLLGRGLGV